MAKNHHLDYFECETSFLFFLNLFNHRHKVAPKNNKQIFWGNPRSTTSATATNAPQSSNKKEGKSVGVLS